MPAKETRPNERRQLIRARTRAARQALTAECRTLMSSALAERLIVSLTAPFPHTILGYAATDEEIDPSPALNALRDADSVIAYPRISGPGTLSLHVCSARDLKPGPLGILQPGERARVVKPAAVELVIVPGVAFDVQGNRLGYGAGYYDRLLGDMPHARRVGVCFDEQVVREIPVESHDIPMHMIITPTRTFRSHQR